MSKPRNSSSTPQGDASEPLLVDIKGDVPFRNEGRNIMLAVCSFILVTEFCERLAYYGLTGSLTSYFTSIGFSNSSASNITSLFTTVNYLTPMIGAYIADTLWGRYKTILYFSILYAAGLGVCVVAGIPHHESTWLFMLGLFGGVCFGSGGIKSSVVVLGADQFDLNDPEQVKQKDSFFNYFYWSINIGATFSFGFLAYLAVNGIGDIPKNWGYFFSFLIPMCVFIIGTAIFYLGKDRYHTSPPAGSEFSKFCSIVWAAAKAPGLVGKMVLLGAGLQVPAFVLSTVGIFITDEKNHTAHLTISIVAMVLIVGGCALMVIFSQKTEWMNRVRRSRGGTYRDEEVDDAADIMRLFPYLGFLIMFWAIYNQMSGNFVLQACQMDVRIGGGQFSGAQLSLMDSAVILLFIPIFDRLIYPLFERVGQPLTMMRRIGCGFFLTSASMAVAGWLEIKRRDSGLVEEHGHNVVAHCAAEGAYMTDMSIYLQIPQYLLIGLGEILAAITSYELFYSQVPESMRSVCQGLNLLTTSLGGMVTTSVNNICSNWITDDLNKGHLEYVFFAMSGLMILNLIAFMYVSRGFVPKLRVEDDPLMRPSLHGFNINPVGGDETENDESASDWLSPMSARSQMSPDSGRSHA